MVNITAANVLVTPRARASEDMILIQFACNTFLLTLEGLNSLRRQGIIWYISDVLTPCDARASSGILVMF